jgi:enoyl-CoA hydratase
MEVLFDEQVATIVMDEGKANSIDPGFVRNMRESLRQVHDSEAHAAVLVGVGNAFSAGLRLPVVSALERPDLKAFMRDFTEMLVDILAGPTPLVAAINGHAIAGGCILAMACDHRVMVHGDYRIGLNEIDLGIRFPIAALEVAMAVLPRTSWTEMLLRGRMANPEVAVGLGLVHQLADRKLLLQAATAVARDFASKPPQAMALLRRDVNARLVERIRTRIDASIEEFADAWYSEETRLLVTDLCEQLAVHNS